MNIRLIGLIISGTGTIFLALDEFGIVDNKYTHPVIFICTLLLIPIWIILITGYLRRRKNIQVTIPRLSLKEIKVKGNEDIAPKYLSPTNPRNSSLFSISFEIDPGENEFEVQKRCSEGGRKDSGKHAFGQKGEIVSDKLRFMTNVIVYPDEAINFKFAKDVFIHKLIAEEIYTP